MRFVLFVFAGCYPPAPSPGPSTADQVSESAERNARAWASISGYHGVRVTCEGEDRDDDGYTSCTLRATERDQISIECAYDSHWALSGSPYVISDCKRSLKISANG